MSGVPAGQRCELPLQCAPCRAARLAMLRGSWHRRARQRCERARQTRPSDTPRGRRGGRAGDASASRRMRRVRARIERKAMLEVADAERRRSPDRIPSCSSPRRSTLAVVSPSTGSSTLPASVGRWRRPVDVEVAGVRRGAAVLEHVEPPRVVAAHDAHVIGHDVEHLAHAVRAQARRRSASKSSSLPSSGLSGRDRRCRSRACCRAARLR